MAERSLRGMKIGASSLETEEGVAFVARRQIRYTCGEGHETIKTFAEEAEIPITWECHCGEDALLEDAEAPEEQKPVKPTRTHWDMLLERRSLEELESLLNERLEMLDQRGGRRRR